MSKELRYLLHGNKEKYDDIETSLYITSQESTLWQKVGRQVLSSRGEDWRLIDSGFVEHILSSQFQDLKIEKLQVDEVIRLISKNPEHLIGIELEVNERYELLGYISQDPDKKDLWMSLKLHETVDGDLESIQKGKVYLEEKSFNLAPKLKGHVILIRLNNRTRQDWIDSWSPSAAITTVLSLSKPHGYYDIILNALPKMDGADKKLLKETNWLILSDNKAISPNNIIEITSKKLKDHLPKLVNLMGEDYRGANQLHRNIRNHEQYKNLCRLFYQLEENEIIDIALKDREPHNHCLVILDAITSLGSPDRWSHSNKLKLRDTAWLVDTNKNPISPDDILYFNSNLVNPYIEELILLNHSKYYTFSQLSKEIRESPSIKLIEHIFISGDDFFKEIGKLLMDSTEYQLGEFNSTEEFPLDHCIEIFKSLDVSFLPAWNFVQNRNIPKDKFKQFLLPNLLGRMEEIKLKKLLVLLSNPDSNPINNIPNYIQVFNTYLEIATQYKTFKTEILPKIRLLNRNGKWKFTNYLTSEGDNLDMDYLLDNNQREIIQSFLSKSASSSVGDESLEPQENLNNENSSELLINYFRQWESHCPFEPIGAFLSLVSIRDDIKIKEQSEFYLGKRNVVTLRERLLDSKNKVIPAFQICITQAGITKYRVTSILGTPFDAQITNLNNPRHLFINEGELHSRNLLLDLLYIQPEKFTRNELIGILKESTKILLVKVYKRVDPDLEAIWNDLLNSDQLDIQVAENYLIESAPYVLRMLGIKDDGTLPTRQILNYLRQLDDLRHQKAEYRQQESLEGQQNTEKAIQEKLTKLSPLLKSDDIKDLLLKLVKKKIQQHGYNVSSIPFEIFQNADDAVFEWQEMSSPKEIEDIRREFIVIIADHQLVFIHLGRPIGCFQHPDHLQDKSTYREKGYDRDLEKMLTFNISDKEDDVTGKFGLGFKSVYLSCNQPRILSKRLGFSVVGGIIPSRLTSESIKELQEKLNLYNIPTEATIIELNIDIPIDIGAIISKFKTLANISIVFSKAIRKCRFIEPQRSSQEFTWERQPFLGINGIEINEIKINEERSQRLCFRTDLGDVLLIDMREDNGNLKCTTPNESTFWVTAPTQEKLNVGFIINASFKVTTGRTKLDPTGNNIELAKRIGAEIGLMLVSLCQTNWQNIRDCLGFSMVDSYSFWEFIWQELGLRWQKLDFDDRRDLISSILGGNCGMGHLICNRDALPNALYGEYRRLISITSKSRYFKVVGILAIESCFMEVSNWSNFHRFNERVLIADSRWEEAKTLLANYWNRLAINVSNLDLLTALKNEVGDNEAKVTSEKAKRVGKLISKTFLKDNYGSTEHSSLRDFLQNIRFQSNAESYFVSEQLLSATSDQSEEKLLVGFAPDNRLLHLDYTDTAIDFFYACRIQRQSVSVEVIKDWVFQVQTVEEKQAVYRYLVEGEHRQELAKLLNKECQNSWLAEDQSVMNLLSLMEEWIAQTEKPYDPQLSEMTDGYVKDNDGTGSNANKWGLFGEEVAKEFYEKQNYHVVKQLDESGCGYDFLCIKDSEELFVEVKAINPRYNKLIRITENEWRKMCEIQNLEKYELFIVCHGGESVTQLIRIKSAWKTLQAILSSLNEQEPSKYEFSSREMDPLIALQRSDNGKSNNILIHWKRLMQDVNHRNIEKFPCEL